MRPSSPRQPGPWRQPLTVNQAHDPLPKRHEGRRAKPAETAAPPPHPAPAPLPETAAKRCRTGILSPSGGCPARARGARARAAGTCWTAASWPLAGAGAERGSGQVVGQHDLTAECHRRFPGQPLGVAGVVALRETGEHEQPRPAPQCAKSAPGCASCRHRSVGR